MTTEYLSSWIKSAIYLDHVSRKFVVVFAGTDDGPDIVADIWQGLGGFNTQYSTAIKIGREVIDNPAFAGQTVFTGHSLGGGLASAASVVSGIHADTFNSAGLMRTTLQYDENGNTVSGNPFELAQYDNSMALIDAYCLDWDILSFVQDKTPLQDALGRRILMDGSLDLDIGIPATWIAAQRASGVGWPAVLINLGVLGYKMGLCHITKYYHYGLMFDENTGWDIYGYEDF